MTRFEQYKFNRALDKVEEDAVEQGFMKKTIKDGKVFFKITKKGLAKLVELTRKGKS